VLLRDGRVVAVGTDVEIPKGVPVALRPDAWVIPAFVDASTGLGLVGDLDETSRPVEDDIDLGLVIDSQHRDFSAARAAGIGTCGVLPGDRNVFGGEGSAVKTSGDVVGVVAKLALGPSVLRPGRAPTSRSGVMALLRETLEGAHGAEGTSAGSLSRFASGRTVGIASVAGAQDVSSLIELAERFGLRVALRLAPTLEPKDFEGLAVKDRVIVLGPYSASTPSRVLKVAKVLSAQGATLAFASDAPARPAAALRLGAALAVRYGLPAPRALHALTQGGADALGLGDRIGSLDVGKDADVTVLSGPPLDLRSRVLELYVGGRRVYRRPAPEEQE
jgi:imidazolonepropionase-like amidohydrolase